MMHSVETILYLVAVSLSFTVILSGCTLNDDRDLCCYDTLTMHYTYRPQGAEAFCENIFSLRHFLFDADGIFIRELPPGEDMQYQPLGLGAGTYTMITVGNMSDISTHEHGTEQSLVQFLLRHTALNRNNQSAFTNTDELFWGTKRFTIGSDGKGTELSDSRIGYASNRLVTEMSNIHCHLNVTVEWTNRLPHVGTYEMELSGVHTRYSLDPRNATQTADGFDIPAGDNPQAYRLDVPLRQLELRAEFVTLRYTDTTIPTLSIRFGDESIIPDIDLGKAFRTWGWRPSATHVQEYNILLRVINENRVDVLPMVEGSVVDWGNGGSFG